MEYLNTLIRLAREFFASVGTLWDWFIAPSDLLSAITGSPTSPMQLLTYGLVSFIILSIVARLFL